MDLPLSAESFIPHNKPMLIVDRLLEVIGDDCKAETVFPADSPFVDSANGGEVEPLMLVELVAQSYAAAKGYLDVKKGGKVVQGYLVGITSVSFLEKAYADKLLLIEVHSDQAIDDFFIVDGTVSCDGVKVVEVSLKVWLRSE